MDFVPSGGSGGMTREASFEGRPPPLRLTARTWNASVAPPPSPVTFQDVVFAPLFGTSLHQDSSWLKAPVLLRVRYCHFTIQASLGFVHDRLTPGLA